MSTRVRGMDSISKAADDAHDALQTRKPVLVSSPVRIDLVAPVRMPVATVPMHTKNTSRARMRRRRRSSLAVSAMPSTAKQPRPLECNPIPDYLTLDDIEDLVTDRKGAVEGGTPMALLRWACRCAWLTSCHTRKDANDHPSEAHVYARFSSDLRAFLVTFTDFTTPEDIVETLEAIIMAYPKLSWGVRHFLLQWLDYDFYKVRLFFLQSLRAFMPPPPPQKNTQHTRTLPFLHSNARAICTHNIYLHYSPYILRSNNGTRAFQILHAPNKLGPISTDAAAAENTPWHYRVNDPGCIDLGPGHPPQQRGRSGYHSNFQRSRCRGVT